MCVYPTILLRILPLYQDLIVFESETQVSESNLLWSCILDDFKIYRSTFSFQYKPLEPIFNGNHLFFLLLSHFHRSSDLVSQIQTIPNSHRGF